MSGEAGEVCANCCRKGSDVANLKKCSACKLVSYCNATCQKAHRPKHKRECRGRVAELREEALFQDPPPPEECPICCLPNPLDRARTHYQSCCGKSICGGCKFAAAWAEDEMTNFSGVPSFLCPFCREPVAKTHAINIERVKRRLKANPDDGASCYFLGYQYYTGGMGLQQDHQRAFELWTRGAELGYADAHYNLGCMYANGEGTNIDKKKWIYHLEQGAMAGQEMARYSLGIHEMNEGYVERGLKHLAISTRMGDDASLKVIKEGFMNGCPWISKDQFATLLRAHKDSVDSRKSTQRDEDEEFCTSSCG